MSKKEPLTEHAQAMLVQKHQTDTAQRHLGLLDGALEDMQAAQAESHQHLELMLFQARGLIQESQVVLDVDEEDALLVETSLFVQEEIVSSSAPLLASTSSKWAVVAIGAATWIRWRPTRIVTRLRLGKILSGI